MTRSTNNIPIAEKQSAALNSDSISKQLMRVVFCLYCFVALIVTTIHIVGEYRHTQKTITNELKSYESIFGPVLGKALWDLDREQIADIVKGLSEVPVIVGVKIERTQQGQRILFGGAGSVKGDKNELLTISATGDILPNKELDIGKLFSYQFPIVFEFLGEGRKLGMATLYSDSSVVLDRVQLGFIFLIVNAVIKGIALWVIFLLVSKHLLLKPLQALTEAISKLNFDNLADFDINLGTKKKNELTLIEQAFSRTVDELSRAKLKIIEFNKTLENKVAERTAELLDSENKFHSLSDAAFEGILIIDKGEIINANKTIAGMFGYSSPTDLIGKDAIDLVSPENREEAQNKILTGYEKPYEINGFKKNGSSFPVEAHGKMFLFKGKQVRVTAIRDLTEQKKADAEIKKLQGILPICMHCKGIRDDKGYWNQLEKYISEHSDVEFSHGICEKCLKEHYPEEEY